MTKSSWSLHPAVSPNSQTLSIASHEETLMKTLATLTAASIVALAGASALAQTTAPTPAPSAPPAATAPAPERGSRGPGMSRADFDALTDARMAAIQAGLKLNPEQQQ